MKGVLLAVLGVVAVWLLLSFLFGVALHVFALLAVLVWLVVLLVVVAAVTWVIGTVLRETQRR